MSQLQYQVYIKDLYLLSFQNVYGICKQSKFTIREVLNCPRNHSEWTERAQQLQCHKVQQTCTSRQRFVYHCLPNSYWNKTIELCAPRKYITFSKCKKIKDSNFLRMFLNQNIYYMYIAFNMVRHFIFKPKYVTCSQTLHKTLVDFAIAHLYL